MKSRVAGFAIALAALGAGAALWWIGRPPPPVSAPTISGAALYGAAFQDTQGRVQPLGQFQGKLLVLNFWATWCAPCREEMPAFNRVAGRWRDRGVAVVGISDEAPETIDAFGRKLAIAYPLWSGGEAAGELSRRLGNHMAVLPFTALIDGTGKVRAAKVGAYTESELDAAIARISSNGG